MWRPHQNSAHSAEIGYSGPVSTGPTAISKTNSCSEPHRAWHFAHDNTQNARIGLQVFEFIIHCPLNFPYGQWDEKLQPEYRFCSFSDSWNMVWVGAHFDIFASFHIDFFLFFIFCNRFTLIPKPMHAKISAKTDERCTHFTFQLQVVRTSSSSTFINKTTWHIINDVYNRER